MPRHHTLTTGVEPHASTAAVAPVPFTAPKRAASANVPACAFPLAPHFQAPSLAES